MADRRNEMKKHPMKVGGTGKTPQGKTVSVHQARQDQYAK